MLTCFILRHVARRLEWRRKNQHEGIEDRDVSCSLGGGWLGSPARSVVGVHLLEDAFVLVMTLDQ
jgi:hypothetical protein